MSKNSDRWFLFLWACFALTIVFLRRVFIGDGVRHIAYILTHSVPAIGEARWLLFPAFLFALLRPLFLIGAIHTVPGALIPFGLASVLSSLVYLAALRVWLIQQQVSTSKRFVALAIAAVCPAFLTYATDTAEPLFAATFCAVGLAIVARSQRLALGVVFIALGLLLHQTVFVAIFLLPMAIGWDRLRDWRELRRTAVIVLTVMTTIVALLMIANHISLRDALERIVLVYRNPIHMNWNRGGPLKGIAVTTFGGFPQALVIVPGMHGFREIISGVRHGSLRLLGVALQLGVGFVLVLMGAVCAYRSRRWEWYVALAGFSVLPVVWNNVYGYPKFYMLFPLLAAHVIARARLRVGIIVVGLLAVMNVRSLVADVINGRETFRERTLQYQKATSDTHWISSGWGPDIPYMWPGSDCGMLKSLAKPSVASTVEALRLERTGELMDCFRAAFCSGQPIWTDDWIQEKSSPIGEIAAFHGVPPGFLEKTWWRGAQDGQVVDTNPGHSLYIYSKRRQDEVCADLRTLPTN